MSPELKFLIYSSIVGVIVAALSYAGKKLFDMITKPRPTPVDRGAAITALADAMVDVSTKALEGVRSELEAARNDLNAARGEITEHKRVTTRLQRRVDQLVQVLRDNHLEVPDELE